LPAAAAKEDRSNAHPKALEELRMIVSHLIEREYKSDINQTLVFADQLVELAKLFRQRLTTLVANWLRVGYCQGNFNSDNCAAGGFTLDYGPFGFCEILTLGFNHGLAAANTLHSSISPSQQKRIIICFGKLLDRYWQKMLEL
jgi:uncharacterized protein YdiU (UPF0061 family)